MPPSFFFVLALYLQDGRRLTPLFSGVVFSAVGAGFFAAMLTATAITARLGRQILALGALVVAAGSAALAGAASGVLSTAQQVGGALGVAVVGVVFYRVLGAGAAAGAFTGAFRASLYTLAGLTVLTAGLVQLLPPPATR